MILIRLMLRRHRLLIATWSALLLALCAGTVSAYQSTYSTPEQRAVAVRHAQDNTASTLLYGRLADPGSPAQMFGWEVGAIVTVLAAIMAVLLAVGLTRAAEDDGTMELVRSCGLTPSAPLRAAIAVLVGVATVLAAGGALALGLAVGRVDAVTWPGSLAFGLVLCLTFLLFGLVGVVASQVTASAGGARVAGSAAVGLAFAVRAGADSQGVGWLNWFSPLALRATVRPFEDIRWWAPPLYAVLAVALAGVAIRLNSHREYGFGLLPRRDTRNTRVHIRSGLGLTTRLSGRSILTWTIAVAGVGTLFTAMGSGVVEQSRDGDLDGFLGAQLGNSDPLAGYFAYTSIVVGMLVTAFAVLGILRTRQDEAAGRTDLMLATGARRWQPLLWQMAVTAAGSAVVLGAAGGCAALLAPAVFTGDSVALRAFAYPVGQWPAAMAAAGFAALLVGRWPRATWLAWLPVAAGGLLAMLGQLLGVPDRVRDLSIFTQAPDAGSPDPHLSGVGVLLAVAIGAGVLGVAAMARRDLTTG